MKTRVKASKKIADLLLTREGYRVNSEVATTLVTICDFADELAEEFDADSEPEVLVDVEQVHGLVHVDIVLLTLEGDLFGKFLKLTESMSGFHLSSIDGMLRVQLGVKDLWVLDE